MKESAIVSQILKYLRKIPDCYCWKEHGGGFGHAGLPDIICCLSGCFIAFEVKSPPNDLTELQRITLEKIRAAGGVAEKVTSLDEVRQIIDGITKEERL
jgi:hypothetical protein